MNIFFNHLSVSVISNHHHPFKSKLLPNCSQSWQHTATRMSLESSLVLMVTQRLLGFLLAGQESNMWFVFPQHTLSTSRKHTSWLLRCVLDLLLSVVMVSLRFRVTFLFPFYLFSVIFVHNLLLIFLHLFDMISSYFHTTSESCLCTHFPEFPDLHPPISL